MRRRWLDLATVGVCVPWAAAVLPRTFTGPWQPALEPLYTPVGGALRLLFLAFAAFFAWRGLVVLKRDNPAWVAQLLLTAGFGSYFLSQVTLWFLQQNAGGTAPYPSVADLGFCVAMTLLIAGVALTIRSWLRLSLFPDGGHNAAVAAGIAAIPLVVLFGLTLRSLHAADLPVLQLVADTAYPVLDSVLIVLTVALLRLTLVLGGGTVAAVWRSLLLGFLAMAGADMLFSLFTGLQWAALDAPLDVLYTLAYALFARGTGLQMELLRAQSPVS